MKLHKSNWLGLIATTLLLCIQSYAKLLESGDQAFKLRRYKHHAEHALKVYRKLYNNDPSNVGLAWRLSMATQFVGMRLRRNSEEKIFLFELGKDAALKAIKQDPNCSPCYFWGALNMALDGNEKGIFKMAYVIPRVMKLMRRAAELDPVYAYGGAYRVLGLIEHKLPGILGGSDRDARDYFTKAIDVSPENALNYLVLARLYINGFDDPKKALQTAQRGLAQPKPSPLDIESFEAHGELKALFKKLNQRKFAKVD